MLDQNKKDKRVEESMGQSDKMLRDMLEMANEGVLSTDPREGTIIYANPAAARIFGYDSPDELVGKSYVNFYAYPDQRAFILKRLEKTGSVTNFETTMIKKDGRKVDVLTTVAAQKDANGKIFRADGFFTDITERQHVQEEIARLGSAVDQSIDGIAISDTERYVVYANKAFADIHGYLPEEVIGKMRLRDFYPEEIPMYEAIKNKLASQGSGVIDEERIKKDGTVFPAFASFSRLTNEAGEPTGFVAVVKDITERKQAETEIAKLSSVVAQSIDGIAIADIDGLITYVNLAYAQMHGYTPQEMVGIRLRKLNKRVISGQFRTSTIGDILQQQDVSTLEVEHYRQDGSYFPALISLSFLRDEKGDPAGVASIANDITERKRVQEDVKRLGNAVEQSIDGIAMSDTGPRLTFVNQAFAQMHGYTVDEMLGMKVEGIHSKQQQKEFESRIGQIASEGYWAGEIGHMRKDGSTFPTFMTTTMLKDDDGNPTGIMVVTRDITETKRVEESVRESSERVVDLIASLHNAVFVYMAIDDGQNFVFTEFNYAAEEIEGFSRDEIIGKSVSEVSPRAKGSGLIKALQRVYKTGKPEHYPPSIYKNRGGGPDIWREVWLYKLNSGEVVAEYSDVTGLKSTEETLKQNEQRFRSVTETAADAIISIDSQGLITLWNNEAERMFGYERDEIIGKSVSAIMPQEFQDAHTKAVKRVVTTGKKKIMGQKVEILAIRKDGTRFPIELTLADWKMGSQVFFTAVIRDITERKRIQEEISRLAKFPSQNPNPVLRVDEDGIVIYANDASVPLLKHFGCQANEYLPQDWRKKVSNAINSGVATSVDVEYQDRVMSMTLAPILDLRQVNMYGLDVTERRRMEKELQQYSHSLEEMVTERTRDLQYSEEWQRILLASANDAVYAYYRDENGVASKFTEANAAATQMLGYSRAEFIEMTPFDLTSPDDKGKDYKLRREHLYRDKRVVFESVHVAKNGTKIPVEVSASLFSYKDKSMSLNIVRDITERKKAEQEIQQTHERMLRSEKMAAIGQFSAGIAHDLRNPLNVINNAVHLLRLSDMGGDERVGKYLRILEDESWKSNDIISKLMDFARTQAPILAPVRLYTIINNCLAGFLPPENIEVVVDKGELMSRLPDVLADAGQMGRVFSNLMNNSADAMPDGGKITISAKADSKYVIARFKDTGTGIASQNIEKIFEPLFSTKHAIGGTGIGLAASKAIIDAHNGIIAVKSTEGQGTTFTVKLLVAKK